MQNLSYTPLPDHNFPYQKDLQLGTLLPVDKTKKFADPRRPLNASFRVELDQERIKRQEHRDWRWNGSEPVRGSVAVALQSWVSLIGVETSETPAREEKRTTIDCDKMAVEWFLPDDEYFKSSLNHPLLAKYAGTIRRPPIFMITGLMVAYGARVTTARVNTQGDSTGPDEKDQGRRLGSIADKTDSRAGILTSYMKEPFILGYQLRRIRLKKDGSFQEKDENKFALWDDETGEEEYLLGSLLEHWEIQPVPEAVSTAI